MSTFSITQSTQDPDEPKISSLSDYNACGNFKDALKECDILILPCWKIADLREQKLDVDLWINTHSFGEMSPDISSYYLQTINLTGKYFFSINRDKKLTWKLDSKSGHSLSETEFLIYCRELGKFKLNYSDYPISSNLLRTRPDYLRTLYKRC